LREKGEREDRKRVAEGGGDREEDGRRWKNQGGEWPDMGETGRRITYAAPHLLM
jgi:hypothetical protein